MSHFTVLVVGDSVEEQLAPYDENIPTKPRPEELWNSEGVVDRARESLKERTEAYAEWVSQGRPGLETLKRRFKDDNEAYRRHRGVVESERVGLPPLDVDDLELVRWYTLDPKAYFDATVGKWFTWTTYNPDSKWDWWIVGGRWRNFFILRPGAESGTHGEQPAIGRTPDEEGRADQALNRDVDWEAMLAECSQGAEDEWDAFMAAAKDVPPEAWEAHTPWDALVSKVQAKAITIDEAREAYNVQPLVEAYHQAFRNAFFGPPGEPNTRYAGDRESFVKRVARQRMATFAVVKDGEWYEKGKMGWWGMASDEKDPDAWAREWFELVSGQPGDTLMTLVDCHI